MQIGLLQEGPKKDVLEALAKQVVVEKEKYTATCNDTNVPVYGEGGKIIKHTPTPLPYSEGVKALDAFVAAITEAVAHCADTDEVAVSAQITVHCPNPA